MSKSLFFLLIILVFAALAAFSLQRDPHDFLDSECTMCHEGDLSGEHGVNDARITALCEQCHTDLFSEGYMHPVDVLPQKVIGIPADLPLSSMGRITCVTCHDVHAPYKTDFGDRSYFLRRAERGRLFCESCHSFSSSKGHPLALGEAHFDSKYIETGVDQQIDPMSKNCISCHDGTHASSVEVNVGVWSHSSSLTDIMSSHPIGVVYEEARMRAGRKTDLRPLSDVDQRILFFDGKVGCGTCHNPYAEMLSHLVMENYQSRLCFACHMLDG